MGRTASLHWSSRRRKRLVASEPVDLLLPRKAHLLLQQQWVLGVMWMFVIHRQAWLLVSHRRTNSVLWASCGRSSYIARRDAGELWNHFTVGEALCIGSLPLACA